jgi:hypothetical protein
MAGTRPFDLCVLPSLQEYWQRNGRADGLSWSENIARNYSTFSRLLKPVAQKQGFTIEV